MPSALDYKSSMGHLFSYLSMLSALDHKSSMGRLFSYLSMLSALDHKPSVCGSLVLLSVCAFGTRPQVLCGSLVLIHRFRLFVSLFSTFAVSRHAKLTSPITSGLDCLDSRLRLCLSLSRLLSCSCRLFLLITRARESNCCWLPKPDLSVWPPVDPPACDCRCK